MRSHGPRQTSRAKQEAPVLFRPGPDLGCRVQVFAEKRQIHLNLAFKNLAALAIIGLDHRHYDLIDQMADAMPGEHSFARACMQLSATLRGIELAHGGCPLLAEPERSQVMFDAVADFLATLGREAKTEGLWFVPKSRELSSTTAQSPQSTEQKADFGSVPRRRIFKKPAPQSSE